MSKVVRKDFTENVETYRKRIKHLKGKCQTLEKLNEYLTSQISKYGLPPDSNPPLIFNNFIDPDAPPPFKNFQLYSNCFANFLSRGKEIMGEDFSLEMVFRMLDKNYENRISTEILSNFLQNTLNLSQTQTTRIILILDEGCNGHVSKEMFHKALDSFQCRSELDAASNKFSLDGLIKPFAEKMMFIKMTPFQFFKMATKNREDSNYMTYEEFESLWKGDLLQMKELDLKELNVLVQVFDQNYRGRFLKFIFIDNMNRLFKRILGLSTANRRYLDSCTKELATITEEKIKQDRTRKEATINMEEEEEAIEEGDQGMPAKFNPRSPIEIPGNKKKEPSLSESKETKKLAEMSKKDKVQSLKKDQLFESEEIDDGDQGVASPPQNLQKAPQNYQKPPLQDLNKSTSKKMEPDLSAKEILMNAALKSGKHIYLCFEAILEDSFEPQLGFTVNDIFSKLDFYYGAYLNKKAKIDILKSIDLNNNGVYDFYELKSFFLECCEDKISVKTLLLVFAKELQAKQMKTEEIFKLNGLDLNTKMNLKQFLDETKPILNYEFSDHTAIFLELCDQNAELCLRDFVDVIDSMRNDDILKNTNKTKALSKQEIHEWSLQVKKNNKYREVVSTFNYALKQKKIAGKELLKRINASSGEKNKQNVILLSKLSEVLKRVFPEKNQSEIADFLEILDEKKTGMITLDDLERILNFEEDKIEIKPMTQGEREEMRNLLNDFLEKKNINMHQFFDLIDRQGRGAIDFNAIKDGLLSQGFNYCNFLSFFFFFFLWSIQFLYF